MNNNRPPASSFQKFERETANQVSLAQVHWPYGVYIIRGKLLCGCRRLIKVTSCANKITNTLFVHSGNPTL